MDISDDDKYKLKECDIKIPKMPISPQKVSMGGGIENELLTIGWIKQCFKTKEFKNLILPPMYIMKMIGSWYNQEEVHFINHIKIPLPVEIKETHHHVIKLEHILSSLI